MPVWPLALLQLTEDQPAHRPFVAAHAVPWPGEIAVFRSPSTDGFELLTTFGGRARIGTLVSDLSAGPTSRFDLGNALVIDLLSGTLESVTDLTLFGGANALAIETTPGVWEIVQAGAAELIAPGRYRLTRLLRGQRGTEGAMANPAPAGARVVILDASLASLSIAEADLGLPWNWRVGPASRAVQLRRRRDVAVPDLELAAEHLGNLRVQREDGQPTIIPNARIRPWAIRPRSTPRGP